MIKSISLLTRKEELSHEEFLVHWVEIHAPLAHAVPRLRRYVQSHIVAERTRPDIVTHDIEIDGIAELWYDNLDDLMFANASPEAKRLHADGATFIGKIKTYTIQEKVIVPRQDGEWPRSLERSCRLSRAPPSGGFPTAFVDPAMMTETCLGLRLQSPAAWLAERAELTPGAEAAVDPHERITYAQLLDRVIRAAGALEACGVGAADRVAYQLPNRLDALVLALAVSWQGATLCPIVPIYREREIGFILDEVRPRVFVTLPEQRGRARAEEARAVCAPRAIEVLFAGAEGENSMYGAQIRTATKRMDRGLDAHSVILFTSGTTSMPKGVIHTDRTLMSDCASLAANDRLTARDVLFVASTVTHVSGLIYAQYLPLIVGCKVCLIDDWSAEAAATMIERERCTWTGGATPFLHALVHDPIARRRDLSSLRIFRCGGAEVAPSLIEAADRAGLHAYRSYGLTEHPTLSGIAGADLRRRAHTDGEIHAHVEIRIVDPECPSRDVAAGASGEVVTRGPDRAVGYLREEHNAETFDREGWCRTGDLGRIVDGDLIIVGRRKDIIIRKGENISAKEIEDLIVQHPAVEEVAVIGLPDSERGERACAVVRLPGAKTLTLADLTRFLDGFGVARQKYPEQIEIVDEFPRTAAGKIKKAALRSRYAHPREN